MMFKKTKPTTRRPVRRIIPRKTIHARAASSQNEIDEYDGESEPSMKLSQAFIVVLVLHVLAVGGIYAFNQFKEKPVKPEAPAPAPEVARSESAPPPPVARPEPEEVKAVAAPKPAATPAAKRETYTVVAGDTLRRIAAKFGTSVEALEKANNLDSSSIIRTGQALIVGTAAVQAEAAPVEKPSQPVAVAEPKQAAPQPAAEPKIEAPAASGKTYTVAKGDNPYNIAKKFNTTQSALMKANNIDDPRKLQIGQKLVIP